MKSPVDLVVEFLEAEQARGVSHVFLDSAARQGMRDLYRRTHAKPQKTAAAAANTALATTQPTPAPPARMEMPAIPAAKSSPTPVPTEVRAEGSTKEERLASLRKQAESWPAARSLETLRETMVFATGNPEARVMLVGEAPGYEEERKQEPFVGPAGQKLNDILTAMGLSRDEVYISNIVKFRPATKNQTTNNRKPSPEEMAACLPFIRAEVGIIRPSCIVALGGTAAEGLLGISGAVGAMRGSWHEFEGIPVRVTYHPSYLLQSGANNSIKRQVWEDMLTVMEKLELTISAKQRGFFLPKS